MRRGEHGVKVATFVDAGRTDEEPADATDGNADKAQTRKAGRRPWVATVFHVSQTDPVPA